MTPIPGAATKCRHRSLPNWILVLALVGAAVGVIGSPLAAAGLPRTVDYAGDIVDAAGAPLSGIHDLTLTYFDTSGELLFVETMSSVEIIEGRLKIELGTGRAAEDGAHDTLAAVFASHPEVALEITVGRQVQAPRIGILPAGHSLKSRLVAAGLRADDDDDPHWKRYTAPGGATAIQSTVLAPAGSRQAASDAADGTVRVRPYTLPVVGPVLSRVVRDLPIAVKQEVKEDTEVNPPRHETLFDEDGNRFGTVAPKSDDVLAGARAPANLTPALNFEFAGISNVNGVLPPDTEGAVGPNHYVQVVNLSFAVYDKSGTLLTGPSNTTTLWAGFGGPCQTDNSGDAIFLYDWAADRFVLTQFAVSGSNQSVCWAVSQTPDPTGRLA